jgi:hypothetical protein
VHDIALCFLYYTTSQILGNKKSRLASAIKDFLVW